MVKKTQSKNKKKGLKPLEKQAIVLFVVLGLIFAGFLAGIAIKNNYDSKKNSFEYKDFTIYTANLEGTALTFYFIPIKISGMSSTNVAFRSDPRDLENISVNLEKGIISPARIKEVWVTTNPDYDSAAIIAAGEIGRFTATVGIKTGYALTYVEEGEFPEKTCDDATENIRVIDIRLGNSSRVYSEDNCIIVESDTNEGMIASADKLAYEWLESLFIKKIDLN